MALWQISFFIIPKDGLDIHASLSKNEDGLFDDSTYWRGNVEPSVFDLKTRMAGGILQKFSNYKIRLAIVGDFDKYGSKSLNDFIFESNKGGTVNFVSSVEKAININK